ncbi:hypothetical protein EJB05_03549, partial [Eragrostis curvula]
MEPVATACADEAGLCDPVRPGVACFRPNTVAAHASYVFSVHWNRFSEDYGGCYFGGFAVETTVDPIELPSFLLLSCSARRCHGSCRIPSIVLK